MAAAATPEGVRCFTRRVSLWKAGCDPSLSLLQEDRLRHRCPTALVIPVLSWTGRVPPAPPIIPVARPDSWARQVRPLLVSAAMR